MWLLVNDGQKLDKSGGELAFLFTCFNTALCLNESVEGNVDEKESSD